MTFFHMQNLRATLRRVSKYLSQSRQANKAIQSMVYPNRELLPEYAVKNVCRFRRKKSCSSCSLAIQNITKVHKAHIPQCHLQPLLLTFRSK